MVEKKLFKTKICILYEKGGCNRQSCSFAHGDAELRRFTASASASFNGRRDYRGTDLRDKLERRHSPQRRYSPGRDFRGRHALHGQKQLSYDRGYNPSRSPSRSERRHRMKQHVDGQSDISGSVRVSDGSDGYKGRKLVSSSAKDELEDQLNQVQLDVDMLDNRKCALEFEGAYNMLNDLKEMNMKPTTYMYNAILGGHFREKNFCAAELVLAQMKGADVKPDCQTFSYLISNSEREQDIVKYYEVMQAAKVPATKHIYMALINAYVKCGQFEKAKQVVLDKGLPAKNMNEVKSVCVSALASCGQMSDALELYEEIKQAGCHLEPKAVISLIEHLQSKGDLNTLLELLKELKDPDFWFDGCERVVGYCIRHKHISFAIDLLKQLKDQDEMLTYAALDQVFCRIYEIEPIDLQIGLDLLQVVKEELMLFPSRTSLDFLLSACVSARDPRCGRLVCEEYLKAGLAFNVLTYLRIYQLHLACGEYKDAEKVLGKMPLSDPHVRTIVKACELTYGNKSKKKKKKKKASRANRQ